MRKRLGVSLGAVAVALLVLAPSAPAATTEAGLACTGIQLAGATTLLATPEPGDDPLYSPPVKPTLGPFPYDLHGIYDETPVITRWSVRVGEDLAPLVQQFGVFRPAGGSSYTKVFEQTETLAEGSNEFEARIPVAAGDVLGLYGPAGTLDCGGRSAMGVEGPVGVGETRVFEQRLSGKSSGISPPGAAVVEPDLDDDGYGDESQDECPSSANFHDKCPPLAYLNAKPRREVIYVTLEPTSDSQVGVSCRVALPGDESGDASRVVRLSKPTRKVRADKTVIAKLTLPRAVREKLDELPRKRALRARIAVRTIDATGKSSVRMKTVKLRGRGG